MKENKPQLNAEMEKRYRHLFEGANTSTRTIDAQINFLATALEEQKIKSYDEGFLAGKMYARMTTIDEVESWLVEEPEHFVSKKNPANMGKNNIKAKIKNELRAELRAKLAEMKE